MRYGKKSFKRRSYSKKKHGRMYKAKRLRKYGNSRGGIRL